jgi:hypothetical protein
MQIGPRSTSCAERMSTAAKTAYRRQCQSSKRDDPVRYIRVAGALFPDMVREAIKDSMAEAGITEEDVREMVRKLESPARDQ